MCPCELVQKWQFIIFTSFLYMATLYDSTLKVWLLLWSEVIFKNKNNLKKNLDNVAACVVPDTSLMHTHDFAVIQHKEDK